MKDFYDFEFCSPKVYTLKGNPVFNWFKGFRLGRRVGRAAKALDKEREKLNSAYGKEADLPIYESARQSVLGLVSKGPIAPGEVFVIGATPFAIFKPKELFVYQAHCFVIETIVVGRSHQFISSDGVPAQALIGRPFFIETIQVAQPIHFHVRNIGTNPAPFLGCLYGTAVY